MKKTTLLVVAVLALLFSACKKSDNDAVNNNIFLTRIAYANGNTQVKFTYNGKQLAKAETYVNSLNTTPTTYDFSYDQQGRLSTVLVNNGNYVRAILKYAGNNIDTIEYLQATYYSPIYLKANYQNNRLSSWATTDRIESLNYDANGNCMRQVDSRQNPTTSYITDNFTFDNKSSLRSALPNADYFFITKNAYLGDPSSANNVLTSRVTAPSGGGTITINYTNVYEYNNYGYPSKITYSNDNGPIGTTLYEYTVIK